jgi:hypothetical protein
MFSTKTGLVRKAPMGRSGKPETQRAALLLLAKGYSPVQIARIAGVSRQLVERWGMSAGVDWQRVRDTNLANAWRRALDSKGPQLPSERAGKRILTPRVKAQSDKDYC